MTFPLVARALAGLLTAAAALTAVPAPAAAAEGDPSLQGFAMNTLDRARRSIAVGPTVGAAMPLVVTDGGEVDFTLSFGLGLYVFDVPVLPDPAAIKEMIASRVKEKVEAHVKAMIAEGKPAPTQAELEQYAREVFEEVKAEVLGGLKRRGSHLEKPRAALDLEYTTIFGADAWQTRATFGFGIGKLTIGPTIAYDATDDDVVRLGPQIDLRILTGRGPRSPVVDLFVRWDFALYDRDIQPDQLGIGARFLLDII